MATKKTEEKKAEIEELIEQAEQGIESYFVSEDSMKEYLDFKANFYKYSLLNNLMIQRQFPHATAVGSYTFFKSKGFSVKKGEKGIKVRAMFNNKYYKDSNGKMKKTTEASPEEKRKIKSGQIETIAGKSFCKLETVFDISQTTATAEDLPKLFPNRWLEGTVKDYALLEKGARNIAAKQGTIILDHPKSELGVSKGCCYPLSNEIALNPRNSELQNCKTLFHELAHARLHTADKLDQYTDVQRELQAEMTAYVVCKHYDIDTSEYSFSYMHNWTNGKTIEDKKRLLSEVSDTAKSFIYSIDEVIEKEKVIEQDANIEEKQIARTVENDIDLHGSLSGDTQKMLDQTGYTFKTGYLEKQNIKEIALLKIPDNSGFEVYTLNDTGDILPVNESMKYPEILSFDSAYDKLTKLENCGCIQVSANDLFQHSYDLKNQAVDNPRQDITDAKFIRQILRQDHIESTPRLIKNIQKLNAQTGKMHNIDDIKSLQSDASFMKNKDNCRLVNCICKEVQQLELVTGLAQ